MKIIMTLYIFVFALLSTQTSIAGKLDDFETSTNKNKKSTNSKYKNNNDCDGFIDCIFIEPFFDAIVDSASNNLSNSLSNKKQEINNFYIVYDYQDIDDHIHAKNFEVNFELISVGINCKSSQFNESKPIDRLTIHRCHALFLLQRGKSFGFSVGIGRFDLEGNSKKSGTSVTIPVTYNYNSRLSFKVTYEQYESIEYFDAQLFFGKKLRLVSGFKEFSTGNSDLSGPYIGLAYKW